MRREIITSAPSSPYGMPAAVRIPSPNGAVHAATCVRGRGSARSASPRADADPGALASATTATATEGRMSRMGKGNVRKLIVGAALLAACGSSGKKSATAPGAGGGITCEAAVAHEVEVCGAEDHQDDLLAQCKRERWSQPVLACLERSRTVDEASGCMHQFDSRSP